MKKFILSLCFAVFLSAGLVSCTDDSAEVAPDQSSIVSPSSETNNPTEKGSSPTKP